MQIESDRQTEYDLEQWGIWSRQDKRLTITAMDYLKKGGMGADISDEYASLIDSLVKSVERINGEGHIALVIYYAHGKSTRDLAKRMKCSHAKARDALKCGQTIVDTLLKTSARKEIAKKIGLSA